MLHVEVWVCLQVCLCDVLLGVQLAIMKKKRKGTGTGTSSMSVNDYKHTPASAFMHLHD